MPDFAIVDAHVHLLDPQHLGYGWTKDAPSLGRQVLPSDVYQAAEPVKIGKFVFVEVDVDDPQHVAEARWVQGLADADPRLAGMVAALPLERGLSVQGDLEKLLQLPALRSVRRLIQSHADAEFCVQPGFIDGLKLLAPHDIAFDICIYHHQLASAIKMVKACPEVRFVLDHIGKPGIKAGLFDPWRQQMTELAALPNVWCKISGVATEADHGHWTRDQLKPYIAHAIDSFGFNRCMFGSDWHVAGLATTYADWVAVVDWVTAGASADEKRQLFRDTATTFYRLDHTA